MLACLGGATWTIEAYASTPGNLCTLPTPSDEIMDKMTLIDRFCVVSANYMTLQDILMHLDAAAEIGRAWKKPPPNSHTEQHLAELSLIDPTIRQLRNMSYDDARCVFGALRVLLEFRVGALSQQQHLEVAAFRRDWCVARNAFAKQRQLRFATAKPALGDQGGGATSSGLLRTLDGIHPGIAANAVLSPTDDEKRKGGHFA